MPPVTPFNTEVIYSRKGMALLKIVYIIQFPTLQATILLLIPGAAENAQDRTKHKSRELYILATSVGIHRVAICSEFLSVHDLRFLSSLLKSK
jgi:hypothetical protein